MAPSQNGPLDGSLVRRLLSLPAGSDDAAVVGALQNAGAERLSGAWQQAPAQTVEDTFRSTFGIDPGTSTDNLNASILSHLVKEAADEQDAADTPPGDANEEVRRRLGISKDVWDKHNGSGAVQDAAKPRALSTAAQRFRKQITRQSGGHTSPSRDEVKGAPCGARAAIRSANILAALDDYYRRKRR